VLELPYAAGVAIKKKKKKKKKDIYYMVNFENTEYLDQ